MSDIPEITCNGCGKIFLESQLRMKQITTEFCPFCNGLVRSEQRTGATNMQLLLAEDVAAIDAWLDNHGKSSGKKVQQRQNTKKDRERLWSLEIEYPFACEVSYDFKHPGLVGVGFYSAKHFDAIFDDKSRFQFLAANHGLEADGKRGKDVDWIEGETISGKWGVKQRFSTNLLCEEWFDPLFKRLGAAMKEAMDSIADH